MKMGKTGASELMRDITLKGGWEASAQSESLWASSELILLFSDTKKML